MARLFAARLRPLAAAAAIPIAMPTVMARAEEFNKKSFITLTCVDNQPHNATSHLISFEGAGAPEANGVVNVKVRAQNNSGSEAGVVVRCYNPITVKGLSPLPGIPSDRLVLMVKKYEGGLMGTHLHAMKPGDTIEVQGPNQQFGFKDHRERSSYIMIAGGTGITPLFQAAHQILSRSEDPKVTILQFARNDLEVPLQEQLDALQEKFPGRLSFQVFFSEDAASVPDALEQIKKDPDTFYMVCGRPQFTAAVAGPKTKDFKQGDLAGHLKDLGVAQENVWKA